jgi:hypothetical protein
MDIFDRNLVGWVIDGELKSFSTMTREEAITALKECHRQLLEAQQRNRNTLREWRRVSEATGRTGPNQSATTWKWTW